MGLSWSVISISDARETLEDWCEKCGVDLSTATATGRYPTPNEVRFVLDTLEGYQSVYFNTLDRTVIHAYVSNAISSSDVDAFSTGSIETKGEIIVAAMNDTNAWVADVSVYAPDDVTEVGAEVPHHLSFRKGNLELNIIIAERLSTICGSLLLFEGSYGPYLIPILVNPGDIDPDQVLQRWEECYENYGQDFERWLGEPQSDSEEWD